MPARDQALSDDLPPVEWQRRRNLQAGAAPPGPLTGRPGAAAIVAGALNRLSSQPNSAAPVNVDGFSGRVSRGAGRDVYAHGRAHKGPLGVDVDVSGVLEPPSGRAEVAVSGLRASGALRPPERIRVFNTPTGELDFELSGPVRLGPFGGLGAGTYIIGTRDPRRR